MNLVALRLVAHTIKPIEGFDKRLFGNRDALLKATEIAKRNKVFLAFYEGLMRITPEIPEYINKVAKIELKRKMLYEEALAGIAEKAEQEGIEFMVFKSIKPFLYLGDDIDFFLSDKKSYEQFIELLKDLGYSLMGYGPPEATLVKKVSNVHIIADVHKALSASYVSYINGKRVWERRIKRKFLGIEVLGPSLEDEMLILAADSLMKDFRIDLAKFYHAVFLIAKIKERSKVVKLAYSEGLSGVLEIFLYAVDRIHRLFYDRKLLGLTPFSRDFLPRIACKLIDKNLKSNISMPWYYPLSSPITAYLSKLMADFSMGGKGTLNILNMLRAPFTTREGVGMLLNYLRLR